MQYAVYGELKSYSSFLKVAYELCWFNEGNKLTNTENMMSHCTVWQTYYSSGNTNSCKIQIVTNVHQLFAKLTIQS